MRVRNTLSILLVVLLASMFLGGTRARADDNDEATLRDIYTRFDEFIQQKNVNGIAAYLSEKFTFKPLKGKTVHLKQWKEAFERSIPQIVDSHTRVLSVLIHGKGADVHTWSEQRYCRPDKKQYIVRAGAVDHWVKTADGWRLKSSRQDSIDVEPIN